MQKALPILMALIIAILCIGLPYIVMGNSSSSDKIGEFVKISSSDYPFSAQLCYDAHTHIMYYRSFGKSSSYLCPYYSTNGYMCRYDPSTNEIEEIIPE